MDIFNIVVGVFTIAGAIASICSAVVLSSLLIHQRNSGNSNSNSNQINKGYKNSNSNIQF